MLLVNYNLVILLSFVISTGAGSNTLAAKFDTEWWKHTIVYHVYIPSFKDSNGDGFGDIIGVNKKLDHFVDLGVGCIYLSPYFQSPMKDFGYDISNYTNVDPAFGTSQDFDELMKGVKKRGLKVIIDLVINHSSDEHPWFEKSIDRIHPYTDFYVWADPAGYDAHGVPNPPNNWVSNFEGCAWEWNAKRKQFYLHQFSIPQPDFNLRNVELKKEIKKILKFWMDKGVAGFRVDAPKFFIEDEFLRNEPLLESRKNVANPMYYDYDHIYTVDLWESYEFLHELRNYIQRYSVNVKQQQPYEKIMVAEAYTDQKHTMAYYGTEKYPVTHFPFNFVFVSLRRALNATAYNEQITQWLKTMPKGATPNWVAENHDNPRLGSRLCEEYMDLVTITLMTLPGVACVFYGEEIGMTNMMIREDQRKDPNIDGLSGSVRDGQRVPMQWDDTTNAGFTSNHKPWLPMNSNFWRVNVETQKNEKNSRYNLFKTLSQLRRRKTMKIGDFESYIISEWVYVFARSLKHRETFITILNLGTETELVDLHDVMSGLPANLEVVAASINAGYYAGDKIRGVPKFPKMFPMKPLSGIVLTTKIKRKFSNFGSQSIDAAISSDSLEF